MSALTSKYDSSALCVIAAQTSCGHDFYIHTIKYRTDFICYGVCKFQAFNVADSYFAFSESALLKLFYNLFDHPVVSAAFPDLLDSTFLAGGTENFDIHKTDGRGYQLADASVLGKIME